MKPGALTCLGHILAEGAYHLAGTGPVPGDVEENVCSLSRSFPGRRMMRAVLSSANVFFPDLPITYFTLLYLGGRVS